MPTMIRSRAPHPASVLSPDFDLARAGGLASPEDSVAIYRDSVFVITDELGGRMLFEWSDGKPRPHLAAGEWLSMVRADRELLAWAGSPNSASLTASSFGGREWRAAPELAVEESVVVPCPGTSRAFHARRTAPGASACVVYDHAAGAALKRWTALLLGRPVWSGDRLWLRYEAWPRQRLVGLDARTLEVAEEYLTPAGRLTSLSAVPGHAAAIWTDPVLPASLVVADSPSALVDEIATKPVVAGYDVPYIARAASIADVPTTEYVPVRSAIGTLIVLHGGPHAVAWPVFSPLIAYLCRLGWRVLSPNVGSSAIPSSFPAQHCRLGVDDRDDLVRLAAACRGRGPIVVGGWSYGAYVAARAAASTACDGLLAFAGFLSPEVIAGSTNAAVDAFRSAHELPRTDRERLSHLPVLAVHGRLDERVPIANQRSFVGSLRNGSFVELPDESHGVVTDGGAAQGYSAVAAWLAEL